MSKQLVRRIVLGSVLLVGMPAGIVRSAERAVQPSFHVPLPNQEFFLLCRFRDGSESKTTERVLKLAGTMAQQDFDDEVLLPAPYQPVRIRQYLPKAKREQQIVGVSDEQGKPAVQLSIAGPSQSYERWLIADHPDRNRLTSMIATWRYHAVASAAERDELHRQFLRERDRPAMLRVSGAEGTPTAELPADPGATRLFDALGCTVTVRRFYPDFAIGKKTKEPINQSDLRLNPAALIEIDRGGAKEERWVFSKFPEFKTHGGEGDSLKVQLDCPLQARNPVPDFIVVTIGGDRHEVWGRNKDVVSDAPLKAGQRVSIPDSSYVFAISAFQRHGRLEETCRVVEDTSGAATVLRVDLAMAGGEPEPLWLELGKARTVATAGGPLTVLFSSRQPGGKTPGHSPK